MRGRGDLLPDNVRTYFEARIGQGFGGVRVHKGAQAAQSADTSNVKAYTTGTDIIFGAREYAPETMLDFGHFEKAQRQQRVYVAVSKLSFQTSGQNTDV